MAKVARPLLVADASLGACCVVSVLLGRAGGGVLVELVQGGRILWCPAQGGKVILKA